MRLSNSPAGFPRVHTFSCSYNLTCWCSMSDNLENSNIILSMSSDVCLPETDSLEIAVDVCNDVCQSHLSRGWKQPMSMNRTFVIDDRLSTV